MDPAVAVPNSRWEAGAVGYRTHVRARQRSDGQILHTFDTQSSQTIACLNASPDWIEFVEDCASHDDGTVTLTTDDFIPRVTVGRTNCSYTTDDACSPCTVGLWNELYQPNIDIENADAGYRLHSGSMGADGIFTDHVQGVGKLRDIVTSGGRIGRWVQSDNVENAGLAYYEQPVNDPNLDAIYQGDDADLIYRHAARVEFSHPSGLQAHGEYVALAMESRYPGYIVNPPGNAEPLNVGFNLDPDTTAAIYFIRYPRTQGAVGTMVNLLELDGSLVTPDPGEEAGVSAVAFVQLADGHFLLAASANDHGTKGIWFYYSDRDEIVRDTQWRLIDFWEPPCTSNNGTSLDSCYGGSAGMSLLTDCSGGIYLVNLNGTAQTGGSEYQWSQVYRVRQTASGTIALEWNSWQRDNTGTSQLNNPAFRWAGGAYVSEEALPVLYNTERRTNVGDNDYVNGDLYYRDVSSSARASGVATPARAPLPRSGDATDNVEPSHDASFDEAETTR